MVINEVIGSHKTDYNLIKVKQERFVDTSSLVVIHMTGEIIYNEYTLQLWISFTYRNNSPALSGEPVVAISICSVVNFFQEQCFKKTCIYILRTSTFSRISVL